MLSSVLAHSTQSISINSHFCGGGVIVIKTKLEPTSPGFGAGSSQHPVQ